MENKKEIWKPVPDYEDYYHASNLGRIKSLARQYKGSMGRICNKKERILKPGLCGSSKHKDKRYHFIVTSIDAVKKNRYVHQMVYEAFNGIYDKEIYEINHKDGNKQNNNLSNLELVTPLENMAHAIHKGLMKKYKQHYSSKRVIQMDKHGRFMAEYANILLASKIIGIDPKGITNACDKSIKNYTQAGGYKWKYK